MDLPQVQPRAEAATGCDRWGSLNPRAAWITQCLAMGLALLLTTSACADTVSGRAYGPDAKPLTNATLIAKPANGDAVEFKTDAAGNFSVFLDPGRYTVNPVKDTSVEAVIDSVPQPIQQDIHLKKKGR